jgi:hypothetical protein
MNHPASHSRRRVGATLAATCLALLLCVPAQAAPGKRHARPRPATTGIAAPLPSAVAPAGAAGMLIARDPETGALVPPTAEQVRQLTAAERTGLLRTSEGLTEVRFPDGSVMVNLQGRFMEFEVAQRGDDGCPRFFGVNEAASLFALLTGTATAPTSVLEEK